MIVTSASVIGGGAEFRQCRPLGTGAPGVVIECIIGYRVWLGDNCGLRIRMQASDLPGRVWRAGGNFPGFGTPNVAVKRRADGTSFLASTVARQALRTHTVTPDGYGPIGWA